MRQAAEELAGRAAVIQINTEENPSLANRFGVRGIPVVFFLKRGEVVAQVAGAQSPEALINWFHSHEVS